MLTLVSRYDYTYDQGVGPDGKGMKGMISSVTERFRHTDQNLYGPYTTSYGYDPLYQLTSAAYPTFDSSLNIPWSGQTHQWTYDAIGNRTSYVRTGPGNSPIDTATYTYNLSNKGPQLIGMTRTDGEPSVSFTYDANGNTATQVVNSATPVTTTYTWDQDDKMTGFTTSDNSQSAAYVYSYTGDRLQRTLNNVTWKYLYSKEDILKVDQGGANPVYLTQGPGIDDVLAEAVGSNTTYAYKNMLSSVLQLASAAGNVNNSYTYDAWGQATNWPTPGTDNSPYGYTGREWENAGSYYYRARVYTPGAGRFISKDAVSKVLKYKYAAAQPLQYRDPFGRNECCPGSPCPCGKWSMQGLSPSLDLIPRIGGLGGGIEGPTLEWPGTLSCDCQAPGSPPFNQRPVKLVCDLAGPYGFPAASMGFYGFHFSGACSFDDLTSTKWNGGYLAIDFGYAKLGGEGAWGKNGSGTSSMWGGGTVLGLSSDPRPLVLLPASCHVEANEDAWFW